MVKQPTLSSSTSSRPLVRLVTDASTVFGRDIARGAMQYINAHRQWEVHGVLRRSWDHAVNWPKCDGAIIAGFNSEVFRAIASGSGHVVSCSSVIRSAEAWTVCIDNVAVGSIGAQHLVECGLESFSYYGVPDVPPSDGRAEGFVSTIKGRGLSFIPCPIRYSGSAHMEGSAPWAELTEWLRDLPKPIGIMAFDDELAYYLAAACRHAEVEVPEQIAIIGVNNDELLCESACVPLSSVDAGFSRVGFAAARLMHRLLLAEPIPADCRYVRLQPLGVAKRLSTDLVAVNDPQIADAVRYIREHACRPCSVEQVARAASVGRRVLERRFAQKLDRTVGEEIMRVRMDTAKRLLLRPELSLKDIAKLCGFPDDSTFVRGFHRFTSTTPHSYRRATQTNRQT